MHSETKISVVASGFLNSFSGETYADLIYRRCNFSNRLYASWTNSSAGLIASTQPSYSTDEYVTVSSRDKSVSQVSNANDYKQTQMDHDFPSVPSPVTTADQKFLLFKEYLKKSLLPDFDNHPERLKRINEEIIIDSKFSLECEDAASLMSCNELAINKKFSFPNESAKLGICKFCRKNGEPEVVYRGHVLKALDGSVTCPILSRYVCDLCGATGSIAHTRKYCPLYGASLIEPEYRKLSSGAIVYNMEHK